jgi:hypothetical protein
MIAAGMGSEPGQPRAPSLTRAAPPQQLLVGLGQEHLARSRCWIAGWPSQLVRRIYAIERRARNDPQARLYRDAALTPAATNTEPTGLLTADNRAPLGIERPAMSLLSASTGWAGKLRTLAAYVPRRWDPDNATPAIA